MVEAELEEQYSRGPGVLERDVAVSGPAPAPLVAFSWHPAHEGRLLAVCASGEEVSGTECIGMTSIVSINFTNLTPMPLECLAVSKHFGLM